MSLYYHLNICRKKSGRARYKERIQFQYEEATLTRIMETEINQEVLLGGRGLSFHQMLSGLSSVLSGFHCIYELLLFPVYSHKSHLYLCCSEIPPESFPWNPSYKQRDSQIRTQKLLKNILKTLFYRKVKACILTNYYLKQRKRARDRKIFINNCFR